ncbi:MAG: DUF732 domain-containing protein [Hyphomicrobium sp.]|jgi:hypothetical protein
MRTRILASLVSVILLAGCGSAPEPEPTIELAQPQPVTPSPATVEPVEESNELVSEVSSDGFSDEAVREAMFLATMTEIDRGLTVNPDRALGRADNICLDIEQGRDEAQILANAEARYEGGTVPDVTPEQAQLIVNAVRDYRC